MSSWSAAKYAYNSDSETIGIHMWDHSEKWPCFFFHPARAVLAKPVNNIVIGLKSNRAFTLRMFYYNDIEDSMKIIIRLMLNRDFMNIPSIKILYNQVHGAMKVYIRILSLIMIKNG